MGSQARQSIDTSIVSQSRVQLIQCQCKSWLQIANPDINNAFLIKSSLFDQAVYSVLSIYRGWWGQAMVTRYKWERDNAESISMTQPHHDLP